jgi:NADH-quinone oxidoreductase subunit M
MDLPYLSIIIFSPLVGVLIIALLPKENHQAIKVTALICTFVSLAMSFWVYFSYDQALGGFQFEEQINWIAPLGISYHLGADGISLPMLLLTGLVIFGGVLVSWAVDSHPKEFFALLLLLVTGVFGAFSSLDLFLLFVFYELAVLPMFLLIGIWGWRELREYASMKLTLYLLIGSACALIGVLVVYFAAGLGTFDMVRLSEVQFDPDFQRSLFLPIFVGFSVLAAMWPFHSWSPDGHLAAPAAASMLHAGVLMKMGAYSALRVGVNILPAGAQQWLPWLVGLTLVNVIYGAIVALAQTDIKYVIGFSSVSHMGFVTMGVASMNAIGMSGAVMQMFSHGIMTGLFFAVIGLVYRRTHTRHIPSLGGLARKMPFAAAAFVVASLASMGVPGSSGFVAEFHVFVGTWRAYPLIAILAAPGIFITAAYVLRMVQMVFLGKLKPEYEGLPRASNFEKVALFMLAAVLILVGIYPSIMMDLIKTGVAPIVAKLGSAAP